MIKSRLISSLDGLSSWLLLQSLVTRSYTITSNLGLLLFPNPLVLSNLHSLGTPFCPDPTPGDGGNTYYYPKYEAQIAMVSKYASY